MNREDLIKNLKALAEQAEKSGESNAAGCLFVICGALLVESHLILLSQLLYQFASYAEVDAAEKLKHRESLN